jgi:uncharacterized membrane protein
MPIGRGGTIGGLSIVLAGIAPLLLYRVTIDTASPWLIGAVVTAQVTAIVWLVARDLAVRYRAILAVATVAIPAAAILRLGLPAREVGLAVGGVCHAVAYACLLIWFAASLRPGHEPVVTGFARRMRRTMPDKVVRYTSHVTIAWCVFFAAQLVMSAALLVAAPRTVWSSFVNLLNLPLIVAMVLAEFGWRSVLFRHEVRTGLLATLTGLRHIRGVPDSRP